MYRFLANKVKLAGLSKNKILLACAVISSVLIGLAFVSTQSNDAKQLNTGDQNSGGSYIKSNDDTANLMAKIGIIDKPKVESVKSLQESPVLSAKANDDSSIESVPDINKVEEQKFKNTQTVNMYKSISGKTLMYSMKPSSSSVDNVGFNDNAIGQDVKSDNNAYEIKAGSVIPSVMINGINSELAGTVIAIVRANIYDTISRTYLLIPQGSRLVGKYDASVAYAQNRLAVAWNRLIYPDGSSTDLKAIPGTDIAGYSGFYDQVNNHYFRLFGGSFIMGLITGAMQYSQNNTANNTPLGAAPTVGQTMAGSLGQQLGQTGLAITQKNLNVAPTIVIRPNYPFNIIVTSDLRLKPFSRVN